VVLALVLVLALALAGSLRAARPWSSSSRRTLALSPGAQPVPVELRAE
jgi:hypothetical protein